jgi:hypothetical protein
MEPALNVDRAHMGNLRAVGGTMRKPRCMGGE